MLTNNCSKIFSTKLLHFILRPYLNMKIIAQCPYMILQINRNKHALFLICTIVFNSISQLIYNIVKSAYVVIDKKNGLPVVSVSMRLFVLQ